MNIENQSKIHQANTPELDEVPSVITEYFERIGFRKLATDKDFDDYMREKYGSIGERLLQEMNREDPENPLVEFYNLKNQSLSLSIAISAEFSDGLYKQYLSTWLKEDFPAPSRLLDLGCDCGVLTCFYAMLYPEAKITGVDICEPAIQRARELAQRLGLTNIWFEVKDIKDIASLASQHSFDIITSSAVMHEVHKFPCDNRVWRLEEIDLDRGMEPLQRILSDLRNLLTPKTGLYVSVDWFHGSPPTSRWVRALNRAGLIVDWYRSHMFGAKDAEGMIHGVPLTVSFPKDPITLQKVDEVLAFDSCGDFLQKFEAMPFKGSTAELLFKTFSDKEWVLGLEFKYLDGTRIERIEIWQVGQLALTYIYNNKWERLIRICPTFMIPGIYRQIFELAKEESKYARLRISEKGSPYTDAVLGE